MEKKTLTYWLFPVFLFCFLFGACTDVHAQRARKHREGLLKADSIRAQHVADSLALLDTLSVPKRITDLEAPVDTALLARQNDSIQQQMPKRADVQRLFASVPRHHER